MDKNYEDLIFLSKKISNFVVGFEGNVSKKVGKEIIIKSSGSRLDNLKFEDLVLFDFNLNQINNFQKKGSMEIDFHSYLLSYENINYVCHTHPPNTLKILCSNKIEDFANKRLFPDQVIFNGEKSCLIPYVQPGKNLKNSIKSIFEKWVIKNCKLPMIILLQNHGIITFGKTIDECVIKTEICEKSAEIFLGACILGKPNFLTKKSINDLLNDEKEKFRLNNL